MADRAEAAHRRYYGQVYRYVRRRTRSREDAEDVTQTVFTEAVSGLERSTADSPPVLAWLYTVARRRLIDQQRRQSTPSAQVISLEEARLEHRSPTDHGVDVARTLARGIACGVQKLDPAGKRAHSATSLVSDELRMERVRLGEK